MRFFLSYRRDDSLHESHALEKALLKLSTAEYPIEVFIDTEKIKIGQDFEKKIFKELQDSDVVLVIVGNKWLNAVAVGNSGTRKIDIPDDAVRLELGKAIENKIPLVVILLNNACQPGKKDLPVTVANLSDAPSFELNTDFDEFQNGVRKLVGYLRKFPSRRPDQSIQKAQLCFFNSAPSWLQDTSAINLFLNGKKTGEILANKTTYKFSLEQGTYNVQLQRGLLYKSNKLTINLLPGKSTTIAYTWNTFGGMKIEILK